MVEVIQNKKVKIVFVMLDGLADHSEKYDEDYLTPMQKAQTPIMDLLASKGFFGVHDPVQSGLSCGSDTAHMSIFGYNPLKVYDGRGALETMGSGLSMEVGEIAFKSNFAYMNLDTKVVERRRVDRTFPEWGIPLCDALTGMKIPGYPDHSVSCMWATEHRCGLKVSGPNLSSLITGTDPLKDNLKIVSCKAEDEEDSNAKFTAKLIDTLSQAITDELMAHPINIERREAGKTYSNMVTLRGCGQRIGVPSFEETHGFKGCVVAPTAIIRGTALTFNMDIIESEGATGYYDSNLDGKMEVMADTLIHKDYQFGFVHVKGTDDAGHDKNLKVKIEQIEKSDRALARLVEKLTQLN